MKRKKILKIVLFLVLAACVAVAARYAYVMFFNPMSAFDPGPVATPTPAPDGTPQVQPSATPTLSPEEELKGQADYDFMKNKVNILLLGWDESPERTQDEDSELYRDESNDFRSDVLILLTVDFDAKTAKLISIPRDTMAAIHNTPGVWKINAAFAKGGAAQKDGFAYAMATVSDLLGGVPIQYYAGVDMTGLKAVVDALGGVSYDVDVRITLNGRVLEKGYQHLNGQQVLDYCRARKGISTDVGRADRQQRILFAIFDQLKSTDQLSKLPKVFLAARDYISTNLNVEQIAALSVFGLDLPRENLTRATLEGKYITGTIHSNASFYVLHNDKLAALIQAVFGITATPNPRYDAAYVEAQKQGKAALSYAAAADYLVSLMPQPALSHLPDPWQQQREALAQARDALVRLVDLDDAKKPVLLDVKAIGKAQQKLADQLVQASLALGLTQQHFAQKETRNLLPRDIVAYLPQAPVIVEPTPGEGGESGIGF